MSADSRRYYDRKRAGVLWALGATGGPTKLPRPQSRTDGCHQAR